MLWLCLRFPRLPLEVFSEAAQSADATAVVDDQRILVCNRAAIDAGVTPGITPATAQALCGQLTVFVRDPGREADTLQRIAYSCYGFTPAINPIEPECLLMEIGSSLKLFGGLESLLKEIRQQIAEQGFSYRLGLAPTPKAARLLSQLPSSKKPALIDCFDALSGALTQTRQFTDLLHALPLPQLLCEARLQKQFRASGFATLGDLLPLPRAALGRRFGKPLVIYLQQISGELADPQPGLTLPAAFDDTLTLSDAITSTEMLAFPMKRMLIALCGYLQGRQLHCQQLRWQLRLTDNSQQQIELAFTRPQNQLDHFLSLTRLRLESLRFSAPVDSLRLQVTQLHQAVAQMGSLFAESNHEQLDSHAANDLLDRLTTRLGSGLVSRLAVNDSHIPEQAMALTAKLTAQTAAPGDLPAVRSRDPKRPLWLLP
ncbi:MAG: DNA polymerase Y family protein, partial [Gammaproteobacteria bacterium]